MLEELVPPVLIGMVSLAICSTQLSSQVPRGLSHQPSLAPSIGIYNSDSVKSVGPTSTSQHNPHQFHDWNRTDFLVELRHEPHLQRVRPHRHPCHTQDQM